MTTSTSARDAVLERIRAEYVEMPGMNLRLEQVARLCGVDLAACRLILDTLVAAKFLCLRPDGTYTRFTEDMRLRARPARARLESDGYAETRRRAS